MISRASTGTGLPRVGCNRPAALHRNPLLLRHARTQKAAPLRFKPEPAPEAPTAAPTSAPAPVAGSVVQEFVDQRPWAAEIVKLQQDVHLMVQERVETLQLQPTVHAPGGVVQVPTLDGKSEFQVTTYSGQGPIRTPFLGFEVCGTKNSMLVAWFLNPRLCTLRHRWYTDKYYRSVPPGSSPDLVSFDKLYARMQAQTRPVESVAPLLNHFNSPLLWTRLMSGHAALYTYNPEDAKAVAAIKEHAQAMVGLWCALVVADWAAIQSGDRLKGEHLVQECRDLSRTMANYLDADEDVDKYAPMIGVEGLAKLKTTVSGAAALKPGKPWWSE